jgi:quercetin dioxygenase-like cupin family protein
MEDDMKIIRTKRPAMVVAVGIVMLCGVSALLARKPATPETIVLLKRTASWNNVPYTAYPKGQPELTTVRITIPAHSSLPWHTHDMPNTAYLLSGHLTVEERDTGRKATYRAGEAFAESVGNVHRGVTGNEPAVVIVTYAGTRGQRLSVPVEGEHE